MRLNQFFSRILMKCALLAALIPFSGQSAGLEVLVSGVDGSPLIMSDGSYSEQIRPVHVSRALNGLWLGAHDELIADIKAAQNSAERLLAIVGRHANIRNYNGINTGVYDRLRVLAVPGGDAAANRIKGAWRRHKFRRQINARAAAGADRRAREAEENYGFLGRLFAGPQPRKHEAAAKIQAGWRGYKRRQEMIANADAALARDLAYLEDRLTGLRRQEEMITNADMAFLKDHLELKRRIRELRNRVQAHDDKSAAYYEAKRNWMKTHSQTKGWHKRMLKDLERQYPKQVASDRANRK